MCYSLQQDIQEEFGNLCVVHRECTWWYPIEPIGIVSAHCCMYSLSLIIIPRKTTACTIASVRSVIVESTSDVTHEFSDRDLSLDDGEALA